MFMSWSSEAYISVGISRLSMGDEYMRTWFRILTSGRKLGAYSTESIILGRLVVFIMLFLGRKKAAFLDGSALALLKRWRR